MGIKLVATLGGETFDVEFTDDGNVDIIGHDMEFEQTIAALGGKEPSALKLFNLWYKDPGYVIAWYIFNIPKEVLVQLTMNWANHFKHAIDTRDRYQNSYSTLSADDVPWSAAVSVEFALDTAKKVKESILLDSMCRAVMNTSYRALEAAADFSSPIIVGLEYDLVNRNLAADAEKDWQRRQFVKVMKDFGVGTSGT